MSVYDEIEKFLGREKAEAEKAKEAEKNQVSIDPDSYIAKEIKYQTAMLHQMKAEIMEIKGEMKEIEKEIQGVQKRVDIEKQSPSGKERSASQKIRGITVNLPDLDLPNRDTQPAAKENKWRKK